MNSLINGFMANCMAACVIGAFLCGQVHGETVSFTEGTFELSNWETSTAEGGNGGSSTVTQQSSGGIPDAYCKLSITVNSAGSFVRSRAWVFSRRPDTTYDPQTQGSIQTIDYGEHSVMFEGFGNGHQTGPALWQDGTMYLVPAMLANQSTWTHQALNGLTAEDFVDDWDQRDTHPDFSASAPEITFGFYRVLATTDCSYTIVTGLDNWSLTVHPVPEPASALLVGLASLTMLRRKRR